MLGAMAISEGALRISIGVVAAVNLAIGLWAGIAPGSFYDELATYGAENGHFLGDIASAYLGMGIALLVAVYRASWRVPILAATALFWAIHALNHLGDIDEASSDAQGISDTILLALGAAAIGYLAWVATRRQVEQDRGQVEHDRPEFEQDRP
jgi:hypothetical protein